MQINHYDKNGNYIGSTKDPDAEFSEAIGTLIGYVLVLAAPFFLISKLMDIIKKWEHLDFPYSYIYKFYHYMIEIPVEKIIYYGNLIFEYDFTIYPNLNLLLSILIFVISFILVIYTFKLFLKLTHLNWVQFLFVLLLPAILGGCFHYGAEIYHWIFTVK